MLKLAKTSKEMELWKSIVQTQEYQDKMEDSLPQELEIQAVVGASGFGAAKLGKEKLWSASVELTAWKEEGGEIHREEILLSTVADDRLLEHLRSTVKRDSVIRCRVRPSRNGRYLLMTGPAQEGNDPELKEILEEQMREVTMEVEGLGTFVLDRTVAWFETKKDWLGTEIRLSFDRDDEKTMESAMETARTLMEDQRGWDRRIREYAADELLELANDWAESTVYEEESEAAEEDEQLVSREQFMERMELESIQAQEDGEFEFWFLDGDMFYGHSIHVTGNVEDGPDWADIEG